KRPTPLFNYIHILDIGAIEKATDVWIKNYSVLSSQQFETFETLKKMKCFRIFIQYGTYNFTTSKKCQHVYEKSARAKVEFLYDLLKLLPNVCYGLAHLDVNRIKVYGDMNKLIDALPVHKLMSLVLDDLIISVFSLPLFH
ncbi:5406_t:CDS:2, partial [Funneliformis caledonium]